MGVSKVSLRRRDTYVYIDVSNIRLACLKTLGVQIDFVKLLDYLKRKYPNLKDVRYYEGIAKGDKQKQKMFKFLAKQGYTICALERKSYNSTEIEEYDAKCPKCGNKWKATFSRERKAMKSNVDVYLASDMLVAAATAKRPVRILLVSCDGDYAEAIKNIIRLNRKISVTVLATPIVRDRKRNTLSTRLRQLATTIPASRFTLLNINDVRDYISREDSQQK